MIEIRIKEGDKENDYELYIDGSLVVGTAIQSDDLTGEDRSYKLGTFTKDATNRVSEQSLSQFLEIGISDLHLKYLVDWQEAIDDIWTRDTKSEETYSVWVLFNKVSRWRRAYSFGEYYVRLVQLIKDSNLPNITTMDEEMLERMPLETFVLGFESLSKRLPIATQLASCMSSLRTVHDKVVSELESNLDGDSIELSFDFPEEVRVPCEQYLLYFVQFLKDLGVEATAELQHRAGQVLFAVTPADKQTALDKILTALETYLRLPSNPIDNGSMVEYEIAAQRLAANVDHLKGQLRLARAELRLADATIQTQQVTIDRLSSRDVFLESLKNVTPSPREEDKEPFLDGTVALTKVNWKGVEFNLPEIFRRLRRLFKEN